MEYNGQRLKDGSFDNAVTWAHTFTEEADLLDGVCVNCHGDERDEVSARDEEWLEHADEGRVSRAIMDRVEIDLLGQVAGSNNPLNTVCQECQGDERDEVSCTGGDGQEWRVHLSRGRVAESVWETVSLSLTGSTCGWQHPALCLPGLTGQAQTDNTRGRQLPLFFCFRPGNRWGSKSRAARMSSGGPVVNPGTPAHLHGEIP